MSEMTFLPKRNPPATLAFAYQILAALWIICSDGLVCLLPLAPGPGQVAHTAKGWLFVAVTSALLYRTLTSWHRQLAESENRLRQMADTVQEVFWLTDNDKQEILFVNSAYERIWGASCQSLYQQPGSWLQSVLEEDRQGVLDALAGQELGTYEVTYRIRTPQGELRWIHHQAFPVADGSGKVHRVAGVARDITRERQTAQALKDSEERYRCLVELSPEGVAIQLEGQLSFVNTAMVQLFGASCKEDLVGRQMLDLIHPDQKDQASQGIRKVLSGEAIATPRARHLLRLDGSDFEGEILATPFSLAGKRGGMVLIRDIDERNRIASALEQHRSHLEAIIHSSLDCIVAVDQNQAILWLNPAAEDCFGCSSEQAAGQPWRQFFEAEVQVGIRACGERFPLEASEKVVQLADGPVTTVVFRDISERLRGQQKRKELELQLRQSQKMEALGLLAGGVAHDFNNLLTVILGAVSMVEPKLCEDQENLDEIRHAAQRAADLTRQLLTFSRKQVVKLEELDCTQVLEGVAGMLRRLLGAQVQLSTDFAEGLPHVRADIGMLEQVVLNLVVNARDALEENGGSVCLRTRVVVLDETAETDVLNALPGRYVCVEIEDNGCGIDPKDLPHIFDPFFTTKEVGKGTGLGLATVYGIMEQHQGGLQVMSQPGQGTRVRVLFPALSAARAGGPRTVDLHLAQGSGKVLVAEDDLALQGLVRRILERCGYEVIVANTAVEALGIWRERGGSVDYLLTDLVMPGGISGLELGRQLLSEKPELKVIYSSGYSADLLDTRRALKEGDHFLPKPYTPVQLAQALHNCQQQIQM